MVVEPGIGWMELNEFLEPYGLFFPLDPGQFLIEFLYVFSFTVDSYMCFRIEFRRASTFAI